MLCEPFSMGLPLSVFFVYGATTFLLAGCDLGSSSATSPAITILSLVSSRDLAQFSKCLPSLRVFRR